MVHVRFDGERVLAVVAHPDDAELLCAGTLARAQSDGAAVGICVMCQGDKGQSDEPAADDLRQIRSDEMVAAAQILGAELFWGEVPDGELADDIDTRRILIEILRQFRPSLLLAHAPDDYHADHRSASRLADAASWFAASSGHRTSSNCLAAPPVIWWMDTIEMIGFDPDFYIDVSDHVELKCRMMACHQSQLARANQAAFSPLEELMRRQSQVRGSQANVEAAEAFRSARLWKRTAAW